MMVKQETISGPFQGTTFTVINLETRAKLYVPREESPQFPLRYIDVTTATSTSLDMVVGRRKKETETSQIRGLDSHDSPHWTKNLQMGIHGPGSGGQRSKRHPGLITYGEKNGKTCQKQRNEQKSKSIKKPKLQNARKLRGIYFIDPADAEFKETVQNARRKVDVPMPTAMPCKIKGRKCKETPDTLKTRYACIDEADESTRKRLEATLHGDHEKHIAGKGINSLSHYNLAHRFILMSKAMKIPDAKNDGKMSRKYQHGS